MIDEKNVERAIQGDLPLCKEDGVNYPLHEFFLNATGDRLSMGFDELGEKRIAGDLPPSAYKSRSWWSFQSEQDGDGKIRHRHALAWLTAGWRIESLSLEDQEVVFVRFKENTESPSISKKQGKDFYSALKGAGQILLLGDIKNLPNPMGSIAIIVFGLGILLMYFFGIKASFTIIALLLGIWILKNVLSLVLGKAFVPTLLGGFGILIVTLATTKAGSIILGLLGIGLLGLLGFGISGEETWGEFFGKGWDLLKGYVAG